MTKNIRIASSALLFVFSSQAIAQDISPNAEDQADGVLESPRENPGADGSSDRPSPETPDPIIDLEDHPRPSYPAEAIDRFTDGEGRVWVTFADNYGNFQSIANDGSVTAQYRSASREFMRERARRGTPDSRGRSSSSPPTSSVNSSKPRKSKPPKDDCPSPRHC